MIRSWTFTLPLNQWLNLWNDLILKDGTYDPTDLTFERNKFLPKLVSSLKYQSQNAGTNPNNGGSTISLAFDGKLQSGMELLSGSWDILTSQNNSISLDQIYIKSDSLGAGINVTVSAN